MAIWHGPLPAGPAGGSRKARRTARRQERREQVLRRAQIEKFEPRHLMAVSPQLVSIIPNAGEILNLNGLEVRNQEFRELTIRFDEGQRMDEISAQTGGIQIIRAGGDGVVGNGNEVDVTPNVAAKSGFIGIGDRPNEIVVRFSDHLPDDLYQIRLVGSGVVPLRNEEQLPFNNGANRSVNFELDLGPQVIAVVPQPIRRVGGQLQQARNEIEVYFNGDDLNQAAATNPNFYQLIRTRKTANNLDDGPAIRPTSVTYDPLADKVRLVFATDLAGLDNTESVYRLRIGNQYNEPLPPIVVPSGADAGDMFTSATNLSSNGPLNTRTIVVKSAIDALPYGLNWPGGIDEPGHRDVPVEAHLGSDDLIDGVETIPYNFRDDYGTDPFGNPLHNLITEAQKQRAREVFEYYSRYLGVQFVETPTLGFTIATGDLRALDPNVETGPGGVIGLAGGTLAIMDNAEDWGLSEPGGSWFQTGMHEIGHLLGYGHTYDLPPLTIMGEDANQGGGQDPSFPGDNDVVHGRHLHRPESIDIDLYRFQLDNAGVFSAEAVAERLGDSSFLDSVVWVFNSAGELIARNDDYLSEDAFVELELQPGDYYVAVTSTGMSEIDPRIPTSGIGGTSQGNYELRLNFEPSPERTPTAASGIVDIDGTPTLLDGDVDGQPGGEYNFWFAVATAANTLVVDKAAPAGGTGSLASPLNNIPAAFAAATARNGDGNATNDVRVVRIVGNGGADGNLATLSDNLAYEVGFNNLGQALSDGTDMQVPKGVTVMVDAGAIFKLRRANIDVGSRSQGVDRSEGHLQVLGTPTDRVYFTSYHNETLGRDTFALPTTPAGGDWGGIVFRNELDLDSRRTVLENEGIFINYVNHANFTFGGGESAALPGVSFSPISLNEARPAVSFNTITNSAGAAIGADPNSFKDDLFNEVGRSFFDGQITIAGGIATLVGGSWPAWAGQGTLTVLTANGAGPELRVEARLSNTQLRLAGTVASVTVPQSFVLAPPPFTADYRRIGPEIYFNKVRDNPINGLFVQIETRGGEPLDKLEVAARFNDTDIVHVLSENLIIQGTPGGGEVTTFTGNRVQSRLDGRLKIDPGVIVKLDRARIETQIGAQLIAEGSANNRVVFTSLLDDRFGASGTFDTAGRDLGPFSQGTVSALNGVVTLTGGVWPTWAAGAILTVNNIDYTIATRDSDTQVTLTRNTVNFFSSPYVLKKIIAPAAGDWGGLYFGPVSRGSIDHALITFAGGTTSVEGGFASFNAVEIQQGDVRITNSVLENNANGTESGRGVGRFNNDEAVIYVRAAQPTIVGNTIRNNDPGNATAAISINVNALNSELNHDLGRSTGALGRSGDFVGNFGALVRNNRLGGNGVNGMVVRGSTLTTQSVWDDTDIVHVVNDEIIVQNHHTFSGLRLQSSASASLVVKLNGTNAGFTANGVPIDIDDRIGGTVQVLGTPGHPVVLTSGFDSTVGAGQDPDGRPQNETLAGAKAPVSTTSQFDIQFRMSQQNQNNPALVAALNLAAATWEAFLDDPITVVIDVEFADIGTNAGQAVFNLQSRTYDEVRQLMIDDAGPDETILEQLPTFAQLQTQFPDLSYAVSPTMELTRANLAALGVPASQLGSQPSMFDPLTPIDGTMQFNSTSTYDFNPADGITPGAIDIVAVTAHEIGHLLGFTSSVNDVDAGIRNINLRPIDLFRLAPGTGATDFTNAPRLLDPAAPEHVFFDGGTFNRAGITVAPLTQGDIPLSRGPVNGDGFSASHWKDDTLLPAGTQEIGIMDPSVAAGVRNRVSFADSRAFDLIGYNAVSRGSPADWRSIKLERYSNDRNVETVTERETGEQNSTPESAQSLGQLARSEGFDPLNGQQGGSDDQRRLGFEIHGVVGQNSDVDVYSFVGTAGAEIWIDIDRTSHALDSIVELVDASGAVIARSNDSHLEELGQASRFDPSGITRPLVREVFSTDDLYTTNPRDAGFRVILPGPLNTTQRYFVRVRSNSADLSDVDGGQTRGAYQLQLRVREVDEIPGSTIRNADIRFANNGIEVLGTPGHSPLLGESAESSVPNDALANAQDLGNLLIQERGGMSLASALSTWDDVDWYRVEVNWANIQVIPPNSGTLDDNTASLIFDMDYADGAGRPDTNLAIFDEQGRLLYLGGSSNVSDDKVPPAVGSGMNDLSRGSFGEFDPFIGPLHLPANANKTYFVAVSSDVRLPEVISQDPAVRREPLSHLRRVVDDRIGSSWVPPVSGDPMPPPGMLFDPAQINVYPDPWQLNDVALYVLDSNGTSLWTVDPLTGETDSFVGELPGIQPERFGYGDLAMRLDGRLFSFTLGDDDGNSGNYHEFDWRGPAFGANPLDVPINPVGDDGIVPTILGMGTNAGVQFEAMVFQGIGQGSTLWGVGSVDQPNLNYLWAFDQTSGMARNPQGGGGGGGGGGGVDPGNPPPQGPIDMTDPNRMPPIVEALDTEADGGPGGLITGMTIINGVMYFVSEEGGFYKREGQDFEFITTVEDDTGDPIPFSGLTAGPQRVESANYAELMFATDSNGNLYALNVDGELQPVFPDSATSVAMTGITSPRGLAFSTLDYNLWHTTNRRADDAGHGLDPTPDRVRTRRTSGGQSFWFGLERNAGQPGATNYDTNAGLFGTYDLPGGAHGSLTTNTFSLAGYSFGDSPALYFNYLINHDTIVDSFRAYISNDGATWSFLGQTPLPASPPFPVNDNGFDEDLQNVADWRQAKIDLSPYFGQDNLRLRFEFSTEGGRRQGDPDVGTPLGVLKGGEIQDGNFFVLDTTQFEFDMGYSLVVPNGAASSIADGETFTLGNAAGRSATFEFDRDGNTTPGNTPVAISITDTADDIVQAIDAAVASAVDANMQPLNIVTHLYQNRINLEDAVTATQSLGAALVIAGDAPGEVSAGAVPIPIFADMTVTEVAEAMALAIDAGFAAAAGNTDDPAIFTSVKLIKDFVQVFGHMVTDPGPLPYVPTLLPDFTGDPDPRGQNINEDAKDNALEGVYLDDFMIGFTERGEMVLNTQPNTNYTLPNPVPLGKVLTGAYQLEMRRGTNYGIPVAPTDVDPPGFQLTRTFNTNHRFGDSLTLIAPDPRLIHAGATFTVGDGVNKVTFEFDLTGLGVTPGNRPVFVRGAQTAADVAAAIRDAINAVGQPSAGQPDALVTVADVAPPVVDLVRLRVTNHSALVMLSRVATLETDPTLSGIIVDTPDIGDQAGTVNDGTDFLKEIGDKNIHRDQGQLIIQGNAITGSFGYGILVDAGVRDPVNNAPHPGAVRNLQDFNTQRLIPSVTITNNLLTNNSAGGIQFSGDTGVDPFGAVPFGRIINNTIFGGVLAAGIGINVNENSSPTLLNNVVANLLTGIQVDASSASTVIGGTAYHRNTNNTVGTGVGTFPILIPQGTEIFVDSANGNFIPLAGSPLIDSSINSLQDRPAMTTLTGPLGFAPSPILAPERDQLGQLRVNDPAVPSPPGLGADVFKDRGAVERGDFSGPSAALINPVTDAVLDPGQTTLNILETEPVLEFTVQLIDGVQPADPQFGSGIDDRTVINERVLVGGVESIIRRVKLIRDGVELVENADYVFNYDATNNVIHLRPTQGVWAPGHVYRVVLVNTPVIGLRFDNTPITGIRDLAGNPLKANNLQGTTEFLITIDPADFGDAPLPYATLFADQGALHRIVAGLQLGATVTAETNGQPSQGALTDLGDDGVQLSSAFVVGETRQVTVTASAAGRLDAWIDFNRDGDWNDAGEQIFTSRALVAGANTLSVTAPSGSSFGETYARFRFSSAGGLGPTGPALDGEVEDYRLEIQAVASYTLELKYTNNQELYRDLLNRYFVAPGLNVIAEVYVDDNRTIGAAGVRQAFADLAYDNDLIDFDPATLEFGPTFTSGRTGTVDEANQIIDEAGGIAPVQPQNADRQLLFRVRGTVKTDAQAEQTLNLSLNSADQSPAHDTLLFGAAQPVQASYETEQIVVKASAWQNAANRFDVNHNGFITGLDALSIINRLNLQGPAVLPLPGESIPTDNPPTPLYPTPFYDVNGDGRVTAADALAVINELNAGRGGAIVMAAGDDDPAMVAAPIVAAPMLAAASNDRNAPMASSFDVTPVAISVASTGSTAVAPVVVAAEKQRSENAAAVASAIVDLFSRDGNSDHRDAAPLTARAPVSREAADAVFVDDRSVRENRTFVIDRPTPVGGARALESTLEEMGLEPIGRKKKWRMHNL